jgi:ferredoxin-thioredoxin reductase catalytic subunit
MSAAPSEEEIEKLCDKLKKEAASAGYHLNPDVEFTKDLICSLLVNEGRFGYQACPCRLASGKKEEDLDLICPCDYRDPDLDEYDACYCGLYVSQNILKGGKELTTIPERRPVKEDREKLKKQGTPKNDISSLPLPVYRCKVCGYLCARDNPPEICPICKVTRDRFERFI